MLKKFRELFSEKGQGIVEYALLLGFVAIVTVGLFGGDDGGLMGVFQTTLQKILEKFQ